MKTCPQCNKEYGDESAFCTVCGGKLANKQTATLSASGINLGDKNVISGEIIGHKEDIRVSGNATIVKNEDQTREVKTCGFCGKPKITMDGVFCRRCGAFVCEDHFDRDSNQCVKCQRGISSQAEQQYMTLLQDVMSDNRIDPQERQRLDEVRKRLNLTEDRTREIENNYKSLLSAQIDTLGRRERRRLDIARQALMENFHFDEALSVLTPLYERFRDNPDVRGLYLLALIEKAPEQALLLVQGMRFDDLDKSLAHIEILVRQGDLDGAADVIRQVRRAFGEKHPVLLARDAELSIEEYRLTKRAAMLDDARDCIEQLPADIVDPYVLVVKAYLEHAADAKDALDRVAEVLREKNLPPFYLLRLRNRLGLAVGETAPSEATREVATTEPTEHPAADEELPTSQPKEVAESSSHAPSSAGQDQAADVALADVHAIQEIDNRGNDADAYVRRMAAQHLGAWRDAAVSGMTEGKFLFGMALLDGYSIDKNEAQGLTLIQEAAEQGNPDAQVYLGDMYLKGRGVSRDDAEAVKWLRMAADQGNAKGQCVLGICYRDGTGVTKDDAAAVKYFRKAVESGRSKAQANLGWMYDNGRGLTQDSTEAVKWYRKAAEQGDAWGPFYLGFEYANGRGVERDDAEAVKWYRKAAEQGNAAGQLSLGVCYRDGIGVAKDDTIAVQHFREAAERGNACGQDNLGMCYDFGTGVQEDQEEAVKWYRKAADQGHPSALFSLGLCYDIGSGVEEDKEEALKWYRKAAEQGVAYAQFKLGVMYENGSGLPNDQTEALKWYELAAAQGNNEAKASRERLRRRLGTVEMR